ncbi:MAG: flagellar basal body-associated FliL family protein [Micrococcales bacterium]|nr:flagellar basal body-associated FliL family protein [Micrococcales bacterium]MCL2668391.1 flagellar basal body-associated FliL family protein [Micrococcales bacterium]
MPIEQRVVAPKKIGGGKIGANKGVPEVEATPGEEPKPKGRSKKKLIIIAAGVVALVAVAAAYFLVLAPGGEEHDGPARPAAIVQFEPHSLNLADGHYLRLGFALELSKGGEAKLDPAPALDAAIIVFSGRTVAEVTNPEIREELRAELLAKIQEIYGEDLVMGVKFSDYVTQ